MTNAKIALGADWNLHGAQDTAQLNAILNAMNETPCYSTVAAKLGIDRELVSTVATWYQSLWLRP